MPRKGNSKPPYFPHDANARNDLKVIALRAKYGWRGYGIYFALLEIMFETGTTALNKKLLKGTALQLGVPLTKLLEIIQFCLGDDIRLFAQDEDCIWSERLRRTREQLDEAYNRAVESGRKGAAKRWPAGGNE